MLQRASLLLAGLALAIALALLGWRIYDQLLGTWGNMNRRLTDLQEEQDYLVEQLSMRPDFCSLVPDPGPCKGRVQRWYFLSRSGDCLEFPWGGCQGNHNNFLTLTQCRAACRVEGKEELITSTTQKPKMEAQIGHLGLKETPSPDCFLPPQAGPCGDRITRYYHDKGHCRPFQYGGCAGNGNNFFSLAECQRLCIVAADADSNRSGMRRTEDDGDEVRGKEDKGGFSTGKRRLREEWGTRRSGRGRKQLRRDTCHQPPNIGTCQSSVTRWWYDELAGTCSQFQWTGCGGNSNNFGSQEKCLMRCKGSQPV